MRKILLLILTILNVSQAYGQSKAQAIDSVLQFNESDTLPGAAIIVQQNGSTLYTKYFGKADLSNNIEIDRSTVFNIGSISKQFTVFLVLLLEEEGKLSLQDDIRKYIPELHPFSDTITLEQLIRHTSGLKTVNFLARMAGWRQTDLSTHEQMLKLIYRQEQLSFTPGTAYKYSNTGTMLLAEVVQRVSKQSFGAVMKQKVFAPLGMTSTFVREDVSEVFKHEAHSYYPENGRIKKAINAHASIGYSNVYSNVIDLRKWVANFTTPLVGNKSIIDQMESPTILRDGTVVEHAMGQFITPYKGTRQIQHTGGHRAYLAYLGRFTEYDLNIIICSNTATFDLFGTAYKIADLFIEEKVEPKESSTPPEPAFIKLSQQELAQFQGYYWQEEANISRQISTRNDTLIYTRGPGNESYFRAIHPSEFSMLGLSEDITLRFDQDSMLFIEPTGETAFIQYQPVSYTTEELAQFTGLYFSKELNAAYQLVISQENLKAESPKMKAITLSPVMKNKFTTNQWFLNKITFTEDKSGVVNGFYADNVQVDKVWFVKMAGKHTKN